MASVSQTFQERSVEATHALCEALGLSDLKVLSTALAEAATKEAKRNPGFVSLVRDTYRELESLKRPRKTAPRQRKPPPVLVPIGRVEGARIDVHASLDPYFLLQVYGSTQLRDALGEFSVEKLKEAAAVVEQRFPGTKPKNRRAKQPLVDYIVEHLAPGR
jgi:hypothetical protein